MKRTITKFGALAFLTASILFLLGFLLGENLDFSTQAVLGYGAMIISLLFIFFGIKHFRDKENKGKLSFMKALKIGLFIAAFAALGFAIIDYIYTTQINPNFQEEYLTHSIEQMQTELPVEEFEAEKEKLTQQMQNYGGSGALALIMFATVMLIGVMISLISALILQRK